MGPADDFHVAWTVLAVRGSVAAATVAWATAEYLWWQRPKRFAAARGFWTVAALLLTAHALAVFHYVHGWSHQRALELTARQTAAFIGLAWSWGLYVNYAFIALWLADCAWSWVDPRRYQERSSAARDALFAVFLFMFVNGAVVFAPWPARGIGILAVTIAIWSRWTRQADRPTRAAA